MNAKHVEDIANAVLYEGYMLYPYRPSSVKNRQRWNFGVVYPKSYSDKQSGGSDNWFMQTECLAKGDSVTEIRVKVRFLQGVARKVGTLTAAIDEWPKNSDRQPDFRLVDSLQVGAKTIQTWQEAVEREIVLPPIRFSGEGSVKTTTSQLFPAGEEFEPVQGPDQRISGVIVRTRETLAAQVDAAAQRLAEGLYRVSVRISNVSIAEKLTETTRDEALMQSLLSAHTILGIEGGEFVSAIDPPEDLKDFAATCQNTGTWPVLTGEEGRRDTILSSPIILYDYPQIAPESPGNLFDGTEIDEILALRILTLTEDEKNEMREADDRSRQILERTESLPDEHFMKLHGVLRGLRPAEQSDEERQ